MLMQIFGWQTKSIMVSYGIFWSGQLMHCSLPEIRLHFSIVFSTGGRCLLVESRIQEIFSCGIWNSGLWNPEPHYKNWDLESTFHFLESSTWNFGIHFVESRIQESSWIPSHKAIWVFTSIFETNYTFN